MNSELAPSPISAVPNGETISLAAVFTLVCWLGCMAVGVLGLVIPYVRPSPPAPAAEPVIVETMKIELQDEPNPETAAVFEPKTATPPETMNLTKIPAPIPVTQPSPSIAFALPIEAPSRIVDARNAVPDRTEPEVAKGATHAPELLTFGQGEGIQPAPEYPLRARRAGMEGTVLLRLTVDEEGRVVAVKMESPSPWPLLNESATRTVRERWRFSKGKLRVYEVPIRFELTQ